MAKEAIGFHPVCSGKLKSFRPTFHPVRQNQWRKRPLVFTRFAQESSKAFDLPFTWLDETNGERSHWFSLGLLKKAQKLSTYLSPDSTKQMVKEVIGFHPICSGKHKSFRPTFHPAR
jgi:hypothetical protein